MSEWPRNQDYNRITIASSSPESIGAEMGCMNVGLSSAAWFVANAALFIPFVVYSSFTAAKMGIVNGTAASGNVDVGIYDDQGNRLVSMGSTAQAGTSAVQSFDITDTILRPGVYFMAQAHDNTTGTIQGWANTTTAIPAVGCYLAVTAFPLPATVTFSSGGATMIPHMFVSGRSVV